MHALREPLTDEKRSYAPELHSSDGRLPAWPLKTTSTRRAGRSQLRQAEEDRYSWRQGRPPCYPPGLPELGGVWQDDTLAQERRQAEGTD
jgi:hypothetical protein